MSGLNALELSKAKLAGRLCRKLWALGFPLGQWAFEPWADTTSPCDRARLLQKQKQRKNIALDVKMQILQPTQALWVNISRQSDIGDPA